MVSIDMRNKEFEVTEQHLKLIRRMYVGYDAYCEFGAPIIDPKRPYGNSDVYEDMAEILGLPIPDEDNDEDWDSDDVEYMDRLHRETATALQIILRVGEFKPGRYRASAYGQDWEFVDE